MYRMFSMKNKFNNGSECDAGSENVIILAIRFSKVVTAFMYVEYVKPQ